MALIKTINRNGEILTPRIADNVFMAENATVVGDVTVGEGSSLWFNSVLRASLVSIVISKTERCYTPSIRNRLSRSVISCPWDITSPFMVQTSITTPS